MATKTQRIEMRTDPNSEAKIAEAARLSHQSVSSFVLNAATTAAERIIARVDRVVMPADQFDALINSLDAADEAPTLTRAAKQKRRFTRA
jgi:uncharacterized protein (DUF1778 family)